MYKHVETIHHHSRGLFECCMCKTVAFEGKRLSIQKAKTFTFLQECMKAERSFITKKNVSLVTGLELGIKVRGGASCRRLGPALRPPVVPGCEAPGFYRFCRVKMKFKKTDCCDSSSRDNT